MAFNQYAASIPIAKSQLSYIIEDDTLSMNSSNYQSSSCVDVVVLRSGAVAAVVKQYSGRPLLGLKAAVSPDLWKQVLIGSNDSCAKVAITSQYSSLCPAGALIRLEHGVVLDVEPPPSDWSLSNSVLTDSSLRSFCFGPTAFGGTKGSFGRIFGDAHATEWACIRSKEGNELLKKAASDGEVEEALKYFDAALGLHTTSVNALVGRGEALGLLRDLEGSFQSYEAALEIDPCDKKAINARRALLMVKPGLLKVSRFADCPEWLEGTRHFADETFQDFRERMLCVSSEELSRQGDEGGPSSSEPLPESVSAAAEDVPVLLPPRSTESSVFLGGAQPCQSVSDESARALSIRSSDSSERDMESRKEKKREKSKKQHKEKKRKQRHTKDDRRKKKKRRRSRSHSYS